MSHEIEINETTGKAAMAYVGDEPWHGLGQKLEEGASIETWTKEAGLNWEVERSPVEFKVDEEVQEMPARHVLYRGDTKAPLSVVSDTYRVVQPAQIMDFFAALAEKSHAQMETAGSLHGGKVIWALARVGKNLMVKDDAVAPFLLLTTSFDMSTPTIGKFVATRVVCNNTIQVALDEKGRRQHRIPHSTTYSTEGMRAGLEISINAFEAFMQKAKKLADIKFGESEMDRFLVRLLQPETGEIEADAIRKSKTYEKVLALFNGGQLGADEEAIKGTAWGAVNSVTQYMDHEVGFNQSARLMNAWFGKVGLLKEKALELALTA